MYTCIIYQKHIPLVANAAFIAVMAAVDGVGGDDYLTWAMSQINYILGDNNYHISYEIGFGGNFPHKPHHRGAYVIFVYKPEIFCKCI